MITADNHNAYFGCIKVTVESSLFELKVTLEGIVYGTVTPTLDELKGMLTIDSVIYNSDATFTADDALKTAIINGITGISIDGAVENQLLSAGKHNITIRGSVTYHDPSDNEDKLVAITLATPGEGEEAAALNVDKLKVTVTLKNVEKQNYGVWTAENAEADLAKVENISSFEIKNNENIETLPDTDAFKGT